MNLAKHYKKLVQFLGYHGSVFTKFCFSMVQHKA